MNAYLQVIYCKIIQNRLNIIFFCKLFYNQSNYNHFLCICKARNKMKKKI